MVRSPVGENVNEAILLKKRIVLLPNAQPNSDREDELLTETGSKQCQREQ